LIIKAQTILKNKNAQFANELENLNCFKPKVFGVLSKFYANFDLESALKFATLYMKSTDLKCWKISQCLYTLAFILFLDHQYAKAEKHIDKGIRHLNKFRTKNNKLFIY